MADSLTEAELLRFQFAQAQILLAAARLDAANARHEILRLQVSLAYGLGPKDSLNYDTGRITRAPPADQKSEPAAT